MVLDHLCRQPECINPQHLEVTTNRENCTRGRVSKLRGGRQSEHTGVHWEPRNQKWYAQVRIKGKQTYLGAYASEADAAKAYIDALRCPDIYVD